MANKNSKRNKTYKRAAGSRKRVITKRKKNSRYTGRRFEIYAILIMMVSILLIISVFSSQDSGYVNQRVNDFLSYIFGIGKYIIPFFLIVWGASFFLKQIRLLPSRFGWGFFLLFFSLLGIFSNNLKYKDIFDNVLIRTRGGITGAAIFNGLFKLFSSSGAITILSVLIIISILIITRISLISIGKKIREFFRNVDFKIFAEIFKRERSPIVKDSSVPIRGKSSIVSINDRKKLEENNQLGKTRTKFVSEPEVIDDLRRGEIEKQIKRKGTPSPEDRQLKMPIMEESGEDENYKTPPINLLKKSKNIPAKLYKQSIKDRVSTLNKLFDDFNLPAKIDRVVRGPSVTMYELTLSPGVKVQRLFSLEDDFCVALGSADLRILAPIPGKSAIGLEVPNKIRSLVTLGDIYSSHDKKLSDELLSAPLGKSLSGDIIYMNIVEMPHVLIAGATNSGKSSCLNSIVISLLMKAKPSELKFIMIDPKMVELSIYNGIPHLLSPVVVNPKKAASALHWAVEEMEKRFRVLVEKNFKSLIEYNEAAKKNTNGDEDFKPLPYIVLFIDELADLMMVSASEVEDSICRIAQMGRAVGMHLVISTQRPSVNVITGLIKANVPSRIAFMVTSNVDSRVILDCSGADKLIGRGDMLYLPYYLNRPERIQGCFVTTNEIEMITRYIKGEKEPEYNLDISKKISQSGKKNIEEDELFYEALKVVVDFGHASASLLQRRLKVGYSRAARIIDQLENSGYVGEFEGSKPREILISNEELAGILTKQE
jgi:DNA segregation ATPase FtsK/SpoIIIE, S-DNA-T family